MKPRRLIITLALSLILIVGVLTATSVRAEVPTLRVYYLQSDIVDNVEVVRGIEYIHDAILEVEGDLRKLIQATTDVEHSGLIAVAESWRLPTSEELTKWQQFQEEQPQPPATADDLPHSNVLARIVEINPANARPVTVERKYMGQTYDVRCVVTQAIVDGYQAGKISVGDWVIITYTEHNDISELDNVGVVIAKIYKSWGEGT